MRKIRVRKPGRPTKKTEDRGAVILRALAHGVTRRAAAAIGGMSERTLYEWIEEDAAFALAVEKAQAEFMESAARKIASHAPTLLKWTMMLARNDEQLQPVQEKVAIEQAGPIHIHWAEGDPGRISPEPTPDSGDSSGE